MEGGWFSKCGSRLSAAHTCFQNSQELHGLRVDGFQNVVLALAPRTFIVKMQQLHGLRAGGFQNVVLALAPRTFVLNMCKSFTV
eukprot:6106276-Pyramimonas_sp.AAC.1